MLAEAKRRAARGKASGRRAAIRPAGTRRDKKKKPDHSTTRTRGTRLWQEGGLGGIQVVPPSVPGARLQPFLPLPSSPFFPSRPVIARGSPLFSGVPAATPCSAQSSPRSADTTCELDVLLHDRHPFCMDRAQISAQRDRSIQNAKRQYLRRSTQRVKKVARC